VDTLYTVGFTEGQD